MAAAHTGGGGTRGTKGKAGGGDSSDKAKKKPPPRSMSPPPPPVVRGVLGIHARVRVEAASRLELEVGVDDVLRCVWMDVGLTLLGDRLTD